MMTRVYTSIPGAGATSAVGGSRTCSFVPSQSKKLPFAGSPRMVARSRLAIHLGMLGSHRSARSASFSTMMTGRVPSRILTREARQVLVILGKGSSLRWELDLILRSSVSRRTIMIFPPSPTFAVYGGDALVSVLPGLPGGWYDDPTYRPLTAVLEAGQLTVFTGGDDSERSYEVALEAAAAALRDPARPRSTRSILRPGSQRWTGEPTVSALLYVAKLQRQLILWTGVGLAVGIVGLTIAFATNGGAVPVILLVVIGLVVGGIAFAMRLRLGRTSQDGRARATTQVVDE